MKKYLLIAALLLIPVSVWAWGVIIAGGGVEEAGGYTEEVTDTFAGPNDPASGWVESSGSWVETAGGILHRDAAASNNYARFDTALSSADHYVCIKIDDIDTDDVPGVVFRMTTSTSNEYYIIRNNTGGNDLDFRNCSGAPASCNTFHDETSYSNWSDNDIICAGVEGTNTSTIFYFWQNPSADPPEKADADYTISSSNWDAAPDAYADSGTYVGVADMNGNSLRITEFDDFSAGSE